MAKARTAIKGSEALPETPLPETQLRETPLIAQLRERLAANADPELAAQQTAYMKEALPFLGVKLPVVRKTTRELTKKYPLRDAAEWRATFEQLFFEAEHHEQRYAALEIAGLARFRKHQSASLLPLYARMIAAAQWWDLVDEIASRVGDVLRAEPDATRKVLLRWAKHRDIWLRRVAIIAQRRFKQNTDVQLLFQCIEPSLGSPEFFLRKAIGWALRELAYVHPQKALSYVRQHAAVLSPLSKKEALRVLLKDGVISEVP